MTHDKSTPQWTQRRDRQVALLRLLLTKDISHCDWIAYVNHCPFQHHWCNSVSATNDMKRKQLSLLHTHASVLPLPAFTDLSGISSKWLQMWHTASTGQDEQISGAKLPHVLYGIQQNLCMCMNFSDKSLCMWVTRKIQLDPGGLTLLILPLKFLVSQNKPVCLLSVSGICLSVFLSGCVPACQCPSDCLLALLSSVHFVESYLMCSSNQREVVLLQELKDNITSKAVWHTTIIFTPASNVLSTTHKHSHSLNSQFTVL